MMQEASEMRKHRALLHRVVVGGSGTGVGMRNREITSTYIKKDTFALLISLGFLAVMFALTFFAAPLHAQVQSDEDNSINDSFNTDSTVQLQEQNCNVIVEQYNNAVAGDAIATGDAVAATAAEVNASPDVVNTCIQAGGDIVIGSGNDDGNNDGDDNDVVDPGNPDDSSDPGDSDDPGGDPSTGSCEAAREVARLDTEGDSPDFEVTGEFLLIEGNYDPGQFGIGLDIDLFDENGDLVDFVSVDEEGEFATRFNVQPGTYFISATSFGGSFDLVAFDCESDTSGGGGRTTPDNSSSRESSVIPGTYNSGQVLAKTGGSTEAMVGVSPVSAGLMSGGALLVLCGVGIAVRLGRIDFSGRE